MANLTNRLAEVNKTLKRIESQLEILKTITNTFEKRITSLEKQCWRNEQYSRRECVEIVGIRDSKNKTKLCELIEKVASINVNRVCLELRHPLPSYKKNHKIIVKFSRRKDPESLLRNKNNDKNFNIRSIDTDSNKVFINESLCRYHKFLWSKCKKLWTVKWIEAFWVSNGQIGLRTEPEGAVSWISHIQELLKLLPDYNFQSDLINFLVYQY